MTSNDKSSTQSGDVVLELGDAADREKDELRRVLSENEELKKRVQQVEAQNRQLQAEAAASRLSPEANKVMRRSAPMRRRWTRQIRRELHYLFLFRGQTLDERLCDAAGGPGGATEEDVAAVEALLAKGANAKYKTLVAAGLESLFGSTPLHYAARNGWTATVDLLLAHGADGTARNDRGESPADYALENKHPMIVRKCDPNFADKKGAELREAFAKAKRVDVLSCRFNKTPQEELARAGCKKMKNVGNMYSPEWVEDESGEYACTDPKMAASQVKAFLEGAKNPRGDYIAGLAPPEEGVCVFNPNSDNAFLFGGDPLSANAAWLESWREVGLENAKKTGGWCIQFLVQGEMSRMQYAEASMARHAGVPILRVHCGEEFSIFVLEALAEAIKQGKPPSKQETVDCYYDLVEVKVDQGGGYGYMPLVQVKADEEAKRR